MRWLIRGLASICLGVALLPAGAAAATPPVSDAYGLVSAPMQFAVQGSNGYRISVEGSGRRVTLTVESNHGAAIYQVRGKARDGVLRAGFGDLGRITVRFEPSSRAIRRGPPRGCAGKPEVTRRGVFVGFISFRGEDSYTWVARDRARGSTTTSPRWRCESSEGKSDRSRPGAGLNEGLDLPVLAGFTPGSRSGFVAVGEAGPEGLDSVIFIAGASERLGRVRIERFAVAVGKKGTFVFDPGLTSATVSPPQPFSGTGSFQRNPDGTVSWSGTLAVSLPGVPDLALTGPIFTTNLAKPKTTDELLAMIGQPGMAGL